MNPFERYNELHHQLEELNDEIENVICDWLEAHASDFNPDDPDSVTFDGWTEHSKGVLVNVFPNNNSDEYETYLIPMDEFLENCGE